MIVQRRAGSGPAHSSYAVCELATHEVLFLKDAHGHNLHPPLDDANLRDLLLLGVLGPLNHLALLGHLRRSTALRHVGLALGLERGAILWQLLRVRQEVRLAWDVLAKDLWDLKSVNVSMLEVDDTFSI